ncbi:MAG TPA: PHP domain-containing protein [Candidatus Dormibacteraeota bacterium]|jgi:putative hydrolase|nr:PHP domain-containing protein [Candidatus Dormibacteraeota bacterium]
MPIAPDVAARHLAEIAYHLRQLEEPYRARAFDRAALAVNGERDLEGLVARGRLTSIDGVGEGIAKVLAALIEQDSSPYLAELRERAGVDVDGTVALGMEGYQGDLHSHTTWSDGKASMREMAEAAKARGYSYLGITDHSARMPTVHGLGADRLRAQAEEIAKTERAVPGIRLLRGIEVDINEDGSLDLPDDALGELDVVIASPHVGLRMDPRAMTDRMLRAVSHPAVDVIGHPTGRRLGRRPGARYDFERVFGLAAERGVALELDCSPERTDLSPELARMAAELGCRFTLDSDAHSPREFGFVSVQLWCPQLAGLGPERFLNWLTVSELEEVFA